jgi:putative peptidoglycan lipid II flippase
VGNIASRVLGLAREIVKSNLYGASPLLGAYTVAALVPMTLFNLITGGEMVSSSLVPVFSDYASKEKRAELWQVASTVLSLATAVLIIIIIFVELFTEQFAWLAGARNFSEPELYQITVDLMRLATPAVFFLSIASILTGLLFSLKRFTLPAFTGAVFNGTIVVVALLRPDKIESLVWGLLLGSFLQIVMQLTALRDAKFHFTLHWRHPAVRRIIILYTPIIAALIVNQIAIWISYNFAILTGDNSVTYMTYATTLYQFPLGLVVTALSIAILPTLSQIASAYTETKESNPQAAAEKANEYKETLASGLRIIIALILPAMAGLFALALPIVVLLLEHGRFTPADSQITAVVLRIYLFGLPFAAIDQMLVFASYARKDTWRPASVGIVSIVIYTIVAAVLLKPIGLYSLMVADSVKHITHTLMMIWVQNRQIGGLRGYQIGRTVYKSTAAAVVTGLLAYGAAVVISSILPVDTFAARMIVVLIGAGGGIVGYLAMVIWLDIPEVKSVYNLVRHKIGF